MAGLFDFLGGNRAQMPGQASGFGQLLQPEVALPMAAALMGNQGNMGNFANAFSQGGQALAQTAGQNRTYQWLQQNAPEFAQLMDGGLDGQSALELYAKQRFAQTPANEFQEREAAAAQQGLTGDDAQSFILTGQLPSGRFGSAEVGLQTVWGRDADGNYVLMQPSKSGEMVMSQTPEGVTPLSPYERAFETRSGTEAGAGTGTAIAALPGAMQTAQRVSEQVESLKGHSSLGRVLGPFDSRTPAILPGTVEAQSKIDQLRGGAFLEARQMLKGGGAITDFESRMAEQAFARLNQAMGEEEFKAALDEFNLYVQRGLQKLQAQAGMGAPRQPGYGQTLPQGPVDYKGKYGLE